MTFLEPGATITCENGHPICEVAVPLRRFGVPSASDFTNWRTEQLAAGRVPKQGDFVDEIRICTCGAFWLRERPGAGLQLHTEGGWRP